MKSILRKIFGSANDREIKRYSLVVDRVNGLEADSGPFRTRPWPGGP